MIGFPTLPAILKNRLPGIKGTLYDFPKLDNFCVVSSRYMLLAVTSEILTQAYSPSLSKYLGLSMGLGKPLFSLGLIS